MAKNTGRPYEEFVQHLYQAIIQSELLGLAKNINVEINKKLIDKNGVKRQFDIYWEYNLAGHIYKTVIECKDYSSKVSIDKLDAFVGKLNDFPGIRGLFATAKGYQSGAEVKAKQHNIDLLVIREQNDSDWTDDDGTPLVNQIYLTTTIMHSAVITNFNLFIPKEYESFDPSSLQGLNNEIFIINEDNKTEYSLYDLQGILANQHGEGYGSFEQELNFKGKIKTPTLEQTIKGYKVKYDIAQPTVQEIHFDYKTKLMGVVEYLQKGTKSLVFDDHIKYR